MLSSTQLRAAFNDYDKDKSGTLELDEIVKLANSLGEKASKRDLEELFKSIDVDHNNKISFDEFLAWYRVGKHTKLATLLKYQMNNQKYMKKFNQHFAMDSLGGDGQKYNLC